MSDNRRWDTITTTNPINQFIPHNNLYHGRPKIKDWYFICQLLLPFLFLTEYVWDIFKPCSSWQLHMRMSVHFWMICTASFFLFLNFESYLTFNKFYFNVFILICWCYLLLVYFLSAIKSMHWTKQAKKKLFHIWDQFFTPSCQNDMLTPPIIFNMILISLSSLF